jgi:translation initiation factor IF-2
LEQFKAKWQDSDFLRKFNRPSLRLVELRNLEKNFGLAEQYDAAKETKALADQLQAQEEAAMQEHIGSIMKKDFAKVRDRQRRESAVMVAHDDRALEEIERQRQLALEPLRGSTSGRTQQD